MAVDSYAKQIEEVSVTNLVVNIRVNEECSQKAVSVSLKNSLRDRYVLHLGDSFL